MENIIVLSAKARLFLTSSPFIVSYQDGNYKYYGLDKSNRLEENLKKFWKNNSKILFIASNPSDRVKNESYINSIKDGLSNTSLSFQCIELCDGTNKNQNL